MNTWPGSIRSVTQRRDLDRAERAAHRHAVAVGDPQPLRVGRGASRASRVHQVQVAGAAGHRAGVVVLQAPAGDQDQRELVAGRAARRLVGERGELRRARRAARTRPRRGSASRCRPRATGHCRPAGRSARSVTPAKSGVSSAISRIASSGVSKPMSCPIARETIVMISKSVARRRAASIAGSTSWIRRSAFVNVPLLLEERGGGQDHVGVLGRLGLEDLLADQELERLERAADVRACSGRSGRRPRRRSTSP